MPGSSPYFYDPSQDPNANPNNYQTNPNGGNPGPMANPNDPTSNPWGGADPGGNASIGTQNQNAQNNWQPMAGSGSASSAWGGRVDTIDQNPLATGAGQYMQAQQAGSQGAQQQSYLQAQQLAQGKGPSLATQLLNQQAAASMGNQNAMASSASGSQSALARRQAMMQNGQTMQGLGGAAATARAQEQLGAMQMQGQLAGQSRAQDQALAAGEVGMVQNQANLNLGSAGLQEQHDQFQQGRMDKYVGAITSAAGAMMGFDAHLGGGDTNAPGPTGSSLHLKEPNGPSHWILREEPNFLLAVNARTGEHRKILTAPLSPDEHKQAMGKHGAGPIGSYNPGNIYSGDFDMAQMQQWSGPGTDNTGPASQNSAPQTQTAPARPQTDHKGQAGKQIASSPPRMSGYAKDYMVDLQPLKGADVNMGGGGPSQPDYTQQFRQSYDSADDATPAAKVGGGSTNNSIGALTGADANLGGSPPPAAQPAAAPAKPQPSPVRQTGADKLIAQMARPGESGGMGLGSAHLENIQVAPDYKPDYSKEATGYRTLSSLAKGDQASGNWPKGDVDLGQYRAALQTESDEQNAEQGKPLQYFPKYSNESPDTSFTGDPKAGYMPPVDEDKMGRPVLQFKEQQIKAPAKPEMLKGKNSSFPVAEAADFHLGKAPGKVKVSPLTQMKSGGAGMSTPMRGLYANKTAKLDSVSKSNPLTKAFGSKRKMA